MEDGPTITLPRQQLFAIPDASALRILCTRGCIWVTVDDDLRDFVLEPGEKFEVPDARRALIYAMEPSSFLLSAQPQRTIRRRLSKNSSDCSRSPIVWAATRAASSA